MKFGKTILIIFLFFTMAEKKRMNDKRKIAALLLIILLLTSITVVAAKPGGAAKKGHGNAADEGSRLREKAEKELRAAEDLLGKAKFYLEKLGEKAPVAVEKIIDDAEKNLDKAEDLLKKDPARSLALSKHVQALMKFAVEILENEFKKLEIANESRCVKEDLEELKSEVAELLREVHNLTGEEVDRVEELLKKALKLIGEGISCSENNPSKASEKVIEAEILLKKSRDLLLQMASNASKEKEVELEENRSTGIQTIRISVNMSVNMSSREVNLEKGTVIVKALKMGNDTVREETVIASGNQTTITIRKGPEVKNESVKMQITIKRNQNVIGALIEVKSDKNITSNLIDEAIKIEPMKLEENQLKLRVTAPNGTSGRLIIVKLDPSVFTVDKLDEIRVLVNGSMAILASNIIDLVSDVYNEPAYVFVISSEGVSVLIYIPHFSSYTIDIIGIIQETLSSLENALNQILTRDTFVASTILATIILMASASLYIRRKALLHQI